MSSKYDELEKLADLKQKGIITEEEFNNKKKEILGSQILTKSEELTKPVTTSQPQVEVVAKEGCFLQTLNMGCGCLFIVIILIAIGLFIMFK